MQAPNASTRLRHDPTDYARKQQEKKDRAKDLREQRTKGVFSDDHTFAPKTNPKSRGAETSSREEQERAPVQPSANPFDDMPIRPAKRQPAAAAPTPHVRSNNNQPDADEAAGDTDALDNLSRRYPKKAPSTTKHANASPPVPLEPEHDTLFREVKKATGRELDDLPIRRATPATTTAAHSGPCLRNSSCGCPQCAGGGGGGSSGAAATTRQEPLARRREMRATPADDPYACQSNTSRSHTGSQQHEMESSLALLKSKMSQRKSRTAPTNQASLFVEKSHTPAAQSARQPPTASRGAPPAGRRAAAAPAPEPATPARATPNARAAATKSRQSTTTRAEPQDDGSDVHYPPPISSGFQSSSEQPDEYPDAAEEMDECDNCHRRFVLSSFAKHRKICEKVFSAQRKVFNMTAKRLEGTEAEKVAKKAGSGKSGGGKKASATSAEEKPLNVKADWKSKSSAFRDAMKASREVTVALKEGRELPPMKPSAPDPSLIQCEYCQRRFNDKAAERHITFCREKTQRDSLKNGPPKKAPAAAPAAKRAPAKKK